MHASPPSRNGFQRDVAIYGAGIYGLCVAYACARRGASVEVVDPHGIAAGASGGIVGALAPHTPERWNALKAFQLDALLGAEDFWSQIEAQSGQTSGYARCGRLQPIADEHALSLANERADNAQELWRGKAAWRIVPASAHARWSPVSPTGMLIEDTLSARLHPKTACAALAKAITALGGAIVSQAASGAGITVWATGWAGLVAMGKDLGTEVGGGVKGQAALFDCDQRHRPQIFADGINIVPHADGTTAVGSTSERGFDDPAGTDAQLEALLERARRIVPALRPASVLTRWAGVRPRARTRGPLVGPYPGRPGHFIANGGFKIGFGLAPLLGEVMADLILDQRDRRPASFRSEALMDA